MATQELSSYFPIGMWYSKITELADPENLNFDIHAFLASGLVAAANLFPDTDTSNKFSIVAKSILNSNIGTVIVFPSYDEDHEIEIDDHHTDSPIFFARNNSESLTAGVSFDVTAEDIGKYISISAPIGFVEQINLSPKNNAPDLILDCVRLAIEVEILKSDRVTSKDAIERLLKNKDSQINQFIGTCQNIIECKLKSPDDMDSDLLDAFYRLKNELFPNTTNETVVYN